MKTDMNDVKDRYEDDMIEVKTDTQDIHSHFAGSQHGGLSPDERAVHDLIQLGVYD